MRIHTIEPICAYLAKKTGRPVKLVYSRDEEFVSSRTRHPAIIELKTGVKKNGTITAREAKVILDNGAYNDIGPLVLHELATSLCSYYKVENARVNGYLIYTNKPYGGAFRGFGNPQAAFPVESQMDMIANKLKIDPVELRLKNAADPGDVTACGWKITSCRLKECIKKSAEAIGWEKKRGKANNHGVGIAACIHWGGGLRVIESDVCVATVEVNDAGQIYVFTGQKEVGQGSDTVITQIVAEELGVPLKAVKLMPLDTDVTPSFLFAGSPTTFVAGGAAKAAASDAKRQILEAAAEMKGIGADDLDIVDGYIYDRPNEQRLMPVSEATHYSYEIVGNPIIGKGRFNMGPTQYDMETGRGQISSTYSFAAQAVEVAVDPETGRVEVLEFVSGHDCGTAINPTMAEGQIEGGLAQGIGYALTEGLAFDNDGKALNSSFADYKIPRAKDMPRKISSILVESEDLRGPFGAKALGETSMVVTAAAIANAIEDAIGIRIKELPITPEKVVEASILVHK
jgi:CO/xanthine dehydrogenase Mo-binding subunit